MHKHTHILTWALALSASTFSLAASASDLGELTASPTLQMLQIKAPDVTFSSSYFFSLSQASSVSAQATNLVWLVGSLPVFDIAQFGLSLYGGTDATALSTAGQNGNTYQLDEVFLPAGKYRFEVQGLTTGLQGGSYTLAAMATLASQEPPLPSVAEPSTLALLGCGSLIVGMVARRRRVGPPTASPAMSLT